MARRKKKALLSTLLVRIYLVILAIIILSSFGSYFWISELLSHFVVYYVYTSSLFVILFLLSKQYKWALIGIAMILWQGYALLHFWLPPKEDAATSAAKHHKPLEEISILQFNVNSNNDNVNKMAKWIISHSQTIDIVVLLEISERWQVALERVKWSYPYHIAKLVRGNRQIVVLSNLLVDDLEVQPLTDDESAVVIRGTTLGKELPFVLYAVHATPPVLPTRLERRDRVLQAAAERIADETIPYKIMVGDFNMTPFSPRFDEVIRLSGLHDSNEGIGQVMGTWPSNLPKKMTIPIDHLLVSSDIKVNSKQLGPAIGSDHYPVITNISFMDREAPVDKGE